MGQGDVLTLAAVPWSLNNVSEHGHRQQLLELYDREQPALRRYLAMLGLDQETARDVVQDSFLKLHEHLLANGDRSNLRAWLYRVVHNGARNAQMSYGVRKTGRIDDADPAHNPPAKELSPERKLLEEEKGQRLRLAMEQLSEAQRACLVLRSQGMKYREIAQALELSTSTVGENIQRGLERLKGLI